MFDFSWSEILLIGVVALVVIGPKDLPRALRTVGHWVGRARTVAREFQFQIDQMVRESELDEVRKTMAAAASGNPNKILKDVVDPTGEIERAVTPDILSEAPSSVPEVPSSPLAPGTPPELAPPTEPMPSVAMPTIPAPVPPFLQSVLAQEPSTIPRVEPAPAEAAEKVAETAPQDGKSGTHG